MESNDDMFATGGTKLSDEMNLTFPSDFGRLDESGNSDSKELLKFMRAMKGLTENNESESSSDNESEDYQPTHAKILPTNQIHNENVHAAIEEIRKKKSMLMKDCVDIVEMQDNLIAQLLGNVKQQENNKGLPFTRHREEVYDQDTCSKSTRTIFGNGRAKERPVGVDKDENGDSAKQRHVSFDFSKDKTTRQKKKRKSQKSKTVIDQVNALKEIIFEKDAKKEHVMPEQYENNEHVQYWRKQIKTLTMRDKSISQVSGTVSVICLDTSASMSEGNAWQQALQFLYDYSEGVEALAEQGASHDNFILVTFGLEVKVAIGPTKDIGAIKQHIENVTPQGPTPMFAALALSQAIVSSIEVPFVLYNHLLVRPQIILITDGQPSELDRLTGEDKHDSDNIEETKDIICEEAARIKRAHSDLHCVLVGNEDPSFLQMLQERSNVNGLKKHNDGRSMATYTLFRVMNEGDQQFVRTQSINVTRQPKTISVINGAIINWYKESNNRDYPAIGTRVRLATDSALGDSDNDGVGTIIGHNKDQSDQDQLWVNVEWDKNGSKLACRIDSGPNSNSDLEVVDEDRIPPPGKLLAVGSKVIPGPNFKGDKSKTGVVIKLIGCARADVMWNDKTRGQYCYGKWGNVEIEPLIKPVPKSEKIVLLNEKDLTLIAEAIGKNWEFFGYRNGLSEADVDRIKNDNDNAVQQTFKVLQKWKANKRTNATWPQMCLDLDECGQTTIQWEMLEKHFGPRVTKNEKHVHIAETNTDS